MSTAASASPPPRPPAARRWLVAAVVVLAAAALAFLLGPDRPSRDESAPEPPPELPLGADPESPSVDLDTAASSPLLRRHELPAGVRLELEVTEGAVAVAPGPPGSALVELVLDEGETLPEGLKWTAREEAGALRVRIESPRRPGWFLRLIGFGEDPKRAARVRQVRVRLPPDSELSVSTGAGGIRVEDRQAPVRLRSGAGDLVLRRQAAKAEVETGAGDVLVEDAAAALRVRTGAGSIDVAGALGPVVARSGAGGVRLSGEPTTAIVETGAGGVGLVLAALRGTVDVSTGMGGIELELPAGAGCELRAETGLGSAVVEAGGRRLEAPRGEALVATLGGGGPGVSLRSGTGAIRVREAAAAE